MKHKTICALTSLMMVASTVSAADQGWYIGAGVGQSNIDFKKAEADAFAEGTFSLYGGFLTSSTMDDSDNAFNLSLGYKVNANFALEGSYVNLGEATYTAHGGIPFPFLSQPQPVDLTLKYKSSGIALSGIGIIPLGSKFDLHGRLGMYFASNKLDIEAKATTTVSDSTSGTTQEFLYGAGADWHVTPGFSLGVDWTHYNDVGDNNDTPEASFDVLAVSGKLYF